MTIQKLFIAILLNFFGLPGAGQFYLHHRRRGLILTALTVIFLLMFVLHFYDMTSAIMASHAVNGFDVKEVYDLTTVLKVDFVKSYKGILSNYLLGLMAFYLIGLVDLVYLYKKEKLA